MKCNWKVGYLLIGGLVFSSTPAMALPALNGSWRITYYQDPNRNAPLTYCVAFTTATAATFIAGEPLSGTWQQAPGATPDWRGSWLQQGDLVKWWGSANSNQYVTSHQGTVITSSAPGAAPNGLMTGQYQFYPIAGGGPAGGGPEIGAWSAQQVATCP